MDSVLSSECFPPVEFAFAYGSGAIEQAGYSTDDEKMLDMVLVVANSNDWHKQNLINNPHHYASHMQYLGHNCLSLIQEKYPAGVYYNTLIPMRGSGRLMKYGVVSDADLKSDLSSWSHLYLAGRLHKPVRNLISPDGIMTALLRENLLSALRTSLFILPPTFTKTELYLTIAGLSYSGDFRMIFGENPDKVRNIVVPNIHRFDRLYGELLGDLSKYCSINRRTNDDMCFQDMSPTIRLDLYKSLPTLLLSPQSPSNGIEDAALIQKRLDDIVFRSSLKQSIKGIVTAGPTKSVSYTAAKVSKWAMWWQQKILKR